MIIAWDEFEFAERSDLVKPDQYHAHDCGEGHEHLQAGQESKEEEACIYTMLRC